MMKISFEGTPEEVKNEMEQWLHAAGSKKKAPALKQPAEKATTEPTPAPVTAAAAPIDVAPVQPVQAEPVAPVQNTQVTAAPTAQTVKKYTLPELQVAAQALMESRMPDLQALLTKYQVISLTELPEDKYPAFATDLRSMGATI